MEICTNGSCISTDRTPITDGYDGPFLFMSDTLQTCSLPLIGVVVKPQWKPFMKLAICRGQKIPLLTGRGQPYLGR